jgi:hypothetical protein
MSVEDKKNQIYEYIIQNDYVSFAELSLKFDHEEGRNDYAISLPSFENIIVWMGTKEFIDAVLELVNEKKMFFHSANPLIYYADGRALNLPLAKKAIRYKEPHWFPVCIRKVPPSFKKRNKR